MQRPCPELLEPVDMRRQNGVGLYFKGALGSIVKSVFVQIQKLKTFNVCI